MDFDGVVFVPLMESGGEYFGTISGVDEQEGGYMVVDVFFALSEECCGDWFHAELGGNCFIGFLDKW